MSWDINTWKSKPYSQKVAYPDHAQLQKTVNRLETMPQLVSKYEVLRLKEELVKAARGESFILQGGDCAEIFDECLPEVINNKLKILPFGDFGAFITSLTIHPNKFDIVLATTGTGNLLQIQLP